MNPWPSRAGLKAPINRTHSKRFALPAESSEDASASGVRASSAPLSQGRLRFDSRAGSWSAEQNSGAHRDDEPFRGSAVSPARQTGTEAERGSVTRSMFACEQAVGRHETCCACEATAAHRAALRKIRAEMTDFRLYEFTARASFSEQPKENG